VSGPVCNSRVVLLGFVPKYPYGYFTHCDDVFLLKLDVSQCLAHSK